MSIGVVGKNRDFTVSDEEETKMFLTLVEGEERRGGNFGGDGGDDGGAPPGDDKPEDRPDPTPAVLKSFSYDPSNTL